MILVGLIIGFAVGAFGISSIVFPIFWAWPKARRLRQQGQLIKAIPAVQFVAPALIWMVLLFGLLLAAATLSSSLAISCLIGLLACLLGTCRTLVKPSPKERGDMEADFNDTYRSYLKTHAEAQGLTTIRAAQ
jgi:hypothetical protein